MINVTFPHQFDSSVDSFSIRVCIQHNCTMDWVAMIGGIVIAYLLLQIFRAIKEARAPPPAPSKWMVGDITQHTLQFNNGMDYSKPTLISVQGILYDVTGSEEFGRRKWGGGGLAT
jgi:hypothetical protein